MSNLTKALVLVVAIMLIGVGLVVWKKRVGGASTLAMNSISRHEIEMLLADVAKSNPAILKRFAEDPDMKKNQLKSFKQLLAFASEAQKTGLADDPTNHQELENIRAEITAVNYDHEINKDKGPMPPFGFITDDMVKQYWDEDNNPKPASSGFSGMMDRVLGRAPSETRTHQQEFDDFLSSKIALLKANNPEMKDREISDDEKNQAKDVFAKIRIYRAEFDKKAAANELSPEFVEKVNLQVKLQQAQFLARLYSDTDAVKAELKATDEEIQKYIDEHAELNPATKRAQAEEILDRAKKGEDFASLADQYTEDPGNKGPDGKGKGGLYSDVPKGRMVAPFEQAALSLEAGQIAPQLVETDYGFHIIKLERKLSKDPNSKLPAGAAGADGETYDVRHILISTNYKDPKDPMARDMPVKEYVRGKIEEQKEEALLDRLVAENNVTVPDDFTVPELTPEQLDQMKKQQQLPPQLQPQGGDEDAPPSANGKPDAKPAAKPAAPPAKKAK